MKADSFRKEKKEKHFGSWNLCTRRTAPHCPALLLDSVPARLSIVENEGAIPFVGERSRARCSRSDFGGSNAR